MNLHPRSRVSGPLALALLLAPAVAQASILDALGNLWETGKEKVGGLFESGKEAVSGLLGGGPRGGGEELAGLMAQIESAQEAVSGKADNLSEYLNRLNGRAPGAATRPFLEERMRDLETAQRTLGQLYSRLGEAVGAAGGVSELTTEERQRVGLIQRQQQILVATAQQLDHRTDRALAGQPVPPAEPLEIPDGPLPPVAEESSVSSGARDDSRDGGSREEPARPQPPSEEPPPPEATPEATTTPPATEAPEGVQSWGSYEQERREQEEAEREAASKTIVKADAAAAFGGTKTVKADSAAAFDGTSGEEGSGSEDDEQSYGAAGRPGGTPEHPAPAGSEADAETAGEGEAAGGEAGAGASEGGVSVPALTSQPAVASAPKVFDPEDAEMGAWVDEWLQAAGVDEYGRWVAPAAIQARGSADTGGLPRRTWVVAVYGDKTFGTNISLNAYIAARMKGENPAVVRKTNPDGTPLGTEPGGSGPRAVPEARSSGPSGSSAGTSGGPRRRDADYLRLRQALQGGDRGAVKDAYGNYSGGR